MKTTEIVANLRIILDYFNDKINEGSLGEQEHYQYVEAATTIDEAIKVLGTIMNFTKLILNR